MESSSSGPYFRKIMRIKTKGGGRIHASPLRYPGGKTSLFPFFKKVIADSSLSRVTYVEPFAGGAGAALSLLLSGNVERIVINDLDPAIYSFWKSAIFDSEKFLRKMKRVPVTVAEWRRQKTIYANPDASTFDLGFATFFLNRTNVSGILDGGPIGGLDQSGTYKIDARFNKKALAEKIEKIASLKQRITVLNKDGLVLIRDYLNRKNTFVYLDPPYFDKGATLYLNHYKKEDHENLAKELNNHQDSFWLLTYDDKKEIRALYPQTKIHGFSLNYNAYVARVGKEILITSRALASH